jgi:hypothetical protein
MEAVESQLLDGRLERAAEEPGELDDSHAEVLPGRAGQAPAGRDRQVWKRDGKIGESDASASGQRQPRQGAEASPDGQGERRR